VELLAALQRARRNLTPGQLDAEPPASARRSPLHPTTEDTSVLNPVERTSVLDVPTMLLARPRPYDDPAPARRSRPRRSRTPLIWTAVLTAVLLLVGGATYTLSGALYTEVPAIIAQTRSEAVRTLDAAGLQGTFAQQFSETVPAGQVMATDPAVGARTRKSDPVRVTLSRGPERVSVPTVAGRPLDDARKELTAARLTPGTVTEEYSDTAAQGTVIATAPAADAQVAVGAPVALTVSKGMRPVPNVVGMTKDEAEKALRDAGFKPQTAGLNLFGTGKVTSQTPAAGQPARQGSTVTVTFPFI
jgi:eukaryotic-like serine/threonine-protein kinase